MRIFNRLIRATNRQAGYSLAEMMVSMGIMTVVMGATGAALNQASKMRDAASLMTGVNNSLRTGMDLMIRDCSRSGRVSRPGSRSESVRHRFGCDEHPGPPSTTLTTRPSTSMGRGVPGNGLGPTINGVATDTITMLMADNNFVDMPLTAITNTSIDVKATHPSSGAAINIQTGVDRLQNGQLLMLEKGSQTTLVQITTIDFSNRRVNFATATL